MPLFDDFDGNIVRLPADTTNYNTKSEDVVLPEGDEVGPLSKDEILQPPKEINKLTDKQLLNDPAKDYELPYDVNENINKENPGITQAPKGETIPKLTNGNYELPDGDSPGSLESDSSVAKPISYLEALDWSTPNLPNDRVTEDLESDEVGLPNIGRSFELDTSMPAPPEIEIPDNRDQEPKLPKGEISLPSDDFILAPDGGDATISDEFVQAPVVDIEERSNLFVLAPESVNDTELTDGIIQAPTGTNETPNKFGVQSIEFTGDSRLPGWLNNGSNVIDELFANLRRGQGVVNKFVDIELPWPAINTGMNIKQEINNWVADPLGTFTNKFQAFNMNNFAGGKGIKSKGREGSLEPSLPEDKRYEIASKEESPDFEVLAEGYESDERLNQIVEDIGMSQFAFQGRKSVVGMTMRLNHLWDLKIERYGHGADQRTWVPDMGIDGSAFYTHRNKDGDKTGEGSNVKSVEVYRDRTKKPVINDFEDLMPILSYNLDIKALSSKDIELSNGGVISIPESIRRSNNLQIEVIDDENKRWRRWFQRYIEVMYDETTNTAKPYKTCCVKITLYQYRSDWMVLSHKVFLGVLKNYVVMSEGAGNGLGSADIISADFSIVGELPVNSKNHVLNIV